MTQQEFIDRLSIVYRDARNLLVDKGDHDILRGTAHGVSGYMEDAFAVYMATRINKKVFQYIVDKLVWHKESDDSTCGLGGLLNCALNLKEEGEKYRNLKLYGQE